MNVEVENALPDSLEELQQRHKKEKKELQSKIQALRKTVTKGDKKKKKEVTEEISKLESELETKQLNEVASLKNGEMEEVSEGLAGVGLDGVGREPRNTKASRRRAKKAMLLKEQELRIAEQEALNVYGARSTELKQIQEALKQRGLMIREIPSDGDCLYAAVCAGLGESSVSELRKKAAQVLKENLSEYLPFLSHPDTGEILTEDQYLDYCSQVELTSAWGGQIELKAVSEAMKCRIEVVQGSGPAVVVGGEHDRSIVVTYHRHLYGLGEHYNSVQPYKEEEPDTPTSEALP